MSLKFRSQETKGERLLHTSLPIKAFLNTVGGRTKYRAPQGTIRSEKIPDPHCAENSLSGIVGSEYLIIFHQDYNFSYDDI